MVLESDWPVFYGIFGILENKFIHRIIQRQILITGVCMLASPF